MHPKGMALFCFSNMTVDFYDEHSTTQANRADLHFMHNTHTQLQPHGCTVACITISPGLSLLAKHMHVLLDSASSVKFHVAGIPVPQSQLKAQGLAKPLRHAGCPVEKCEQITAERPV